MRVILTILTKRNLISDSCAKLRPMKYPIPPIILPFVVLTYLFSCNGQKHEKPKIIAATLTEVGFNDTTFVNGDSMVVISSDIDELGKLLDFKTYRPTKVQFRCVRKTASNENKERSDYSLQAVLYFDSLTMEKMFDFDRHADYLSPDYKKESFMFNWLDINVLKEMENSSPNYHGHPDFFLELQVANCGI